MKRGIVHLVNSKVSCACTVIYTPSQDVMYKVGRFSVWGNSVTGDDALLPAFISAAILRARDSTSTRADDFLMADDLQHAGCGLHSRSHTRMLFRKHVAVCANRELPRCSRKSLT